jgi:hypothetical protein
MVTTPAAAAMSWALGGFVGNLSPAQLRAAGRSGVANYQIPITSFNETSINLIYKSMA